MRIYLEDGTLTEDDFIDADPENIRSDLVHFWQAWHELRNDRHSSDMGGMSGITYIAMVVYARAHGFKAERREMLFRVVRAMDDEFLNYASEQRKKDNPNGRNEAEIPPDHN